MMVVYHPMLEEVVMLGISLEECLQYWRRTNGGIRSNLKDLSSYLNVIRKTLKKYMDHSKNIRVSARSLGWN